MNRYFINPNGPFKLGWFASLAQTHKGLDLALDSVNRELSRYNFLHSSKDRSRSRCRFISAFSTIFFRIAPKNVHCRLNSLQSQGFVGPTIPRRILSLSRGLTENTCKAPFHSFASCFCEAKSSAPTSPTTVFQHKKGDTKSSYPSDCKSSETKETDPSMAQHTVGHDKSQNFFYIELQGQSSDQQEAKAILEYSYVRPGLVDMYHTLVPTEFRGHGLAKVLTEAALDYFSDQDIVIRPTCTYIQKYLRENPNPRYMDRLEKNFKL